jgi:endonuclease/exonuclease/phosphatase family metal-dependent hydrolase
LVGERAIRVMSFNVRGSGHESDGINAWNNRAILSVEMVEHYAPHLIGFQEFQNGNLDTYREMLSDYGYVLGPIAGNNYPYEFNAIFFDPTRLEVLEAGGFWLSTTPERYSSSWRTRCVRSVNWANLRCLNSGLPFLHLNTHFDHVSKLARVEGSKLLLQKIAEIQEGHEDELPVIVTGDFNCAPGSLPHHNFTEHDFLDTYLAAGNEDTEEAYTYHAFKGVRYSASRRSRGSMRIDWILVKDPLQRIQTKSQLIVRDCDEESGIYPSDHYPVLSEFVLSDQNGKTAITSPAEESESFAGRDDHIVLS